MSSTIAVIPARGGSKRIEKKNLRTVGGKPLVAHAVDHAARARRVDRAIVSTEDDDIAALAKEYGADVPFKRPPSLATDTTPASAVITHALNWLADHGESFDVISLVQPTSPLRRPDDIDGALEKLEMSEASSVISISEYISPPEWAVAENDEGFLEEYFDLGVLWRDQLERSQDLPKVRHPNGAVFAATTDVWWTHESFYTPKTVGYEMPPTRSFDVDEPWELKLVRALF